MYNGYNNGVPQYLPPSTQPTSFTSGLGQEIIQVANGLTQELNQMFSNGTPRSPAYTQTLPPTILVSLSPQNTGTISGTTPSTQTAMSEEFNSNSIKTAQGPPMQNIPLQTQPQMTAMPGQPMQYQPGGITYQQPSGVAYQQPVYQQQMFVAPIRFGPQPFTMVCPSCHQSQVTNVNFAISSKTHIFALILAVFTGCCCIPYLFDTFKTAEHTCSKCGVLLGRAEDNCL